MRIIAFLFIAFYMVLCSPAARADEVQARFGIHPTHTRLVLEGVTFTGYATRFEDSTVTVVLNGQQAFAAAQANQRRVAAVRGIRADMQGDALAVRLQMDKAVKDVKAFMHQGKVVVDIYPETAGRAPPTASSQAETVKAAAPLPPKPAPVVAEAVAEKPPVPQEKPLEIPPEIKENHASKAKEQHVENNAVEGAIPVRYQTGAGMFTLSFPLPREYPMAVFQRAGAWFIVIADEQGLGMGGDAFARAQQDGYILATESIRHSKATIVKLHTVAQLSPTVWQQGAVWNIDFRMQSLRPEVSAVYRQIEAGGQPALALELSSLAAQKIEVRDPAVGDVIWVVPANRRGHGNEIFRHFPEFQVLPSLQGLAVIPQATDITMRFNAAGIILESMGGLRISSLPRQAATLEEMSSSTDVLFDFARWRRVPTHTFFEERQKLQTEIMTSSRSQKDLRRLELAQFQLAHGFAAEVGGILAVIAVDNPQLVAKPPVQALYGASAYLGGTYDKAIELFSKEEFSSYREAKLWLAASQAGLGDYEAAAESFTQAGRVPQNYPARIAVRLGIHAAEALLETGNIVAASGYVDDLLTIETTESQRQRVELMQARVFHAQGKPFEAKAIWRMLAHSNDQWSRIRADYELLVQEYREGKKDREEVIAGLERLRFAWRGDSFELKLLQKLADLYVENNEYNKAMRLLDQARRNFASHPQVDGITKYMRETFKELYLEGRANRLSPIHALSMFDEFRWMVPEDNSGDEMIRRLADRLVSVDLLDRAGDLLAHQIRERLEGVEKARVGARLSLLKLLDKKPDAALEALSLSATPEIPANLQRERLYLQIQALMMKGQYPRSIALLSGDFSARADQLRMEIFWQQQDYVQAAQALRRLINTAPTAENIDRLQAQYVLNLALALSLAQDFNALERLYQQYSTLLKQTPFSEAFELIAAQPSEVDIRNFSSISQRFAEIARFENFLDTYREKMKTEGLQMIN